MTSKRWSLLFKPYLLGLLSIVGGYTTLHWLVVQKLALISLDEMVLNLIIPAALTVFFSQYTLRKRLEILDFGVYNSRRKDGSSLFLWLALLVPIAIAQYYMVSATGQLTQLRSIEEIHLARDTKFYRIDEQFVENEAYRTHDIKTRDRQGLNLSLYAVIPAFQSTRVGVNSKPIAWYGILFSKQLSRGLSKEERERQYDRFKQDSEMAIAHFDPSQYDYFDRIADSKNREAYLEAIRINSQYVSNEIVLVGYKEPFDERYIDELRWLIIASIGSILLALAIFFIPKIDQEALERMESETPGNWK